jgi:hypothetical protein
VANVLFLLLLCDRFALALYRLSLRSLFNAMRFWNLEHEWFRSDFIKFRDCRLEQTTGTAATLRAQDSLYDTSEDVFRNGTGRTEGKFK